MHVTFQNYFSKLRWKVLLQYFNGVSALDMEKYYDFTARSLKLLSVKYICGETAHVCVLIVMHVKYNKVIDKQACR